MYENNKAVIQLKKYNKNRIFQYILNNDNCTKKEIAFDLDLSMPTLNGYMKKLEEKELVVKSGFVNSGVGRKAETYKCNYNKKYGIGVDITKHHVAFIILNLNEDVISHERYRCSFADSEEFFQLLRNLFLAFLEKNNVDESMIIGIGVSLPGTLMRDGRSMAPGDVLNYAGKPLEKFEEALGYPCTFFNDASAAGFAEFSRLDRSIKNAAYVFLSNSVGGAIMIDGEIYSGTYDQSAEIGHLCVDYDGEECYCGRKGCLNNYCNAKVLEKVVDGRIEEFFVKLDQGGEKEQHAWQQYVMYLVRALRNIAPVLDSEVIILGGYVGGTMEERIKDVIDEYNKNKPSLAANSRLQKCSFKIEAAATGAALMHVYEYIENV